MRPMLESKPRMRDLVTPKPTPRASSFELAAWLIQNEQEPPSWREAFRKVKFGTGDNPDYEGERWVVIVAKGNDADRIVEAYDRG